MQFSYLVTHGLRPGHRILDIGCGNLRAGWRLMQYLDTSNYYGVDISPDILLAALKEVRRSALAAQVSTPRARERLAFEFLPDQAFDVIHAHSVFTHTRADVIDRCFASAARILKPDGFFDLTYLEGDTFSLIDEDFCYPTENAAGNGGESSVRSDPDDRLGLSTHRQHKLRLRRRA